MPDIEATVRRYFDGWNSHDVSAITAQFDPEGTFEDATTGGPVGVDLIGIFAQVLFDAFPDSQLPIDQLHVVGDDRVIIEFRIVGTHTENSLLGPATGSSVDLPGVDVITLDPDTGLIRSVRGYWDMAGFLDQLGLQTNPSPKTIDGLIDFGMGVRVHTGKTTEPGCFTVTSTDATGDDATWVNSMTETMVAELMSQPGYLGSCFTVAGGRHYTFTAWESPEAVEGLRTTNHREAMRAMLAGEQCTRIMTSLWVPLRLNVTKAGAAGERPVAVSGADAGQWL